MPSIIQADQLKSADGLTTYLNSGTLSNLTFPTKALVSGNTNSGGHILQVQQKVKTNEFSTASTHGVFTSVTGLDLKITPISDSSKILITYHVCVASEAGDHTGVATALSRGIGGVGVSNLSGAVGTSAGGNQKNVTTSTSHHSEDANGANPMHSMTYLDSPNTTSEIVYQPAVYNASGANFIVYVNRNTNDGNYEYVTKSISTITAMEIA